MYSAIPKMKPSDRKPPLPSSPRRLRPRRDLHSSTPLQTPTGCLAKHQKQPTRSMEVVEPSALRPEYQTISCELSALEKMVRDEFGKADAEKANVEAGSVLQRGRFYDEYSAIRNERLKRKKGVTVDEVKPAHAHANGIGLGVNFESAKKGSARKFGTIRKSVSAAYSMEMEGVTETPRYMLRSRSKENKKPPLPAASSVLVDKRKIGARRVGLNLN
ncbi:hypothetical protein Lal_00004461 [Lupinus albus]|uniref:Uncharacterized protein n=1 Tax=Lupinus albus TaxID=3870 RepID=A0A6A5LVW9_LUPAL|nr:hypothetical protein Lalb_Chr23g0265781 [Lupinus albus]KAF1865087.1 hypothetical protein Lal_00004461 [Lupinus albus]